MTPEQLIALAAWLFTGFVMMFTIKVEQRGRNGYCKIPVWLWLLGALAGLFTGLLTLYVLVPGLLKDLKSGASRIRRLLSYEI